MPRLSAVFFDFDGVLCRDRFYTTVEAEFPQATKFVSDVIFGGDQKYADRWMRGQLTYRDINTIIADQTGIPLKILTDLFFSGVRQMQIDVKLLDFAATLKQGGVKVAIVTNNMDIFNEVTVPEQNLVDNFTVTVNSYDYGTMKHEQNGLLFDVTLKKLGLESFHDVLLIDDSPVACEIFKRKGGAAYRYVNQKEFEIWLKTNW